MKTTKFFIGKIPVIIWGEKSDKAYIYVHGKMSDKEAAETFAYLAENKGYQTISFDLPEHGERKNKSYRCDIWNGISDLHRISSYTFVNWKSVSLFACSLGAYFSLQAYREIIFEKCFFLSPIVIWNTSFKICFYGFMSQKKYFIQKEKFQHPLILYRGTIISI